MKKQENEVVASGVVYYLLKQLSQPILRKQEILYQRHDHHRHWKPTESSFHLAVATWTWRIPLGHAFSLTSKVTRHFIIDCCNQATLELV